VNGLGHHAVALTGVAGDPGSRIHRLDPRAKIVGLLGVTAVAVSTPPPAWPVYLACVAALVMVAAAARVPARTLWRRARVVLPPILLVAAFMPFVRTGGAVHALGPLRVSDAGLTTLAGVGAKAAIGTLAAVLLAATTSFPAVLHGLEALRVPRLFVLIAGVMYRYLFVVAEEAQRLCTALAARGYRPRSALAAAPIGRAVTALFLRTHGRGERIHRAMLARGYRGTMPRPATLVLSRADALFVGLVAGGLLALRVAIGAAA
jgi:cobalt/nickel transport system permease protein